MTQKEKLFNQWAEINHQIEAINGEKFMAYYAPGSLTVNEWKDAVSSANKKLERVKREKQIADFYLTEEGKLYKMTREAAQLQIYEEQKALHDSYERKVKEMVRNLLGDVFDVNFSHSRLEIGLVERYRHDMAVFKFGHDWDIYFGKEYFNAGFRFEMNYGTLGSFKLVYDLDRTTYLAGLAKFASSVDFLEELKAELKAFTTRYDELRSMDYDIDKELKDPKVA